MSDIINFIQNQPDLFFLKGATDEEILQAEKSLGLEFDAEFRKYISVYGVASFNGHELTGICKSRRLNVVDATIEAKEKNTHIIKQNWGDKLRFSDRFRRNWGGKLPFIQGYFR